MAYLSNFRQAVDPLVDSTNNYYLPVTGEISIPPANSFFGVPSIYLTVKYWQDNYGVDVKNFGNYFWCRETDTLLLKRLVSIENKKRLDLLKTHVSATIKESADIIGANRFLDIIQSNTFTYEFQKTLSVISRVRNRTNTPPSSSTTQTVTIDVKAALLSKIQQFVNANRRLPEIVFNEDNSNFIPENLTFVVDNYGVQCPTWALLSVLASGYPNDVILTDGGFRFANEQAANDFRRSYWWNVAPKTGWLFVDRQSFVFQGFIGAGSFFAPGNSLDAILINQFTSGPNYNQIKYFLISDVLNQISSVYKNKLDEVNQQSLDAWNAQSTWVSFRDAAIQGVLRIAGFYMRVSGYATIPGLGAGFVSLLSGSFTYANVLASARFLDALNIIDANKFLSINNFLTSGYNLTQTFLDSIEAVSFTENNPVSIVDIPKPALYTPPTYGEVNMITFDWGNIPDGAGFNVGSLEDYVPLNTWGTGLDWGDIPHDAWGFGDLTANWGFDPDVSWGSISDYVFDPIDFGYDFSGDEISFVASDLAENIPGLTLDQFATLNYVSPADYTEAQVILDETAKFAESTGSDFFAVLRNVVSGIQTTAGAFLTLYTTYRQVENQIENANGRPPARPIQTTRPTSPGQTVRQPDGSVSTMLPDGSIRTVRENGSIVMTPPNSQMPNLNSIFSKQNLLIGGAALGAGALIYLVATKGKK